MLSKFLALMKTKLFIGIASATAVVAAAAVTVVVVTVPEAYRMLKVFEADDSSIVQRLNNDINAYVGMNLESGDVVTVAEDSLMRINLDNNKYISLDGGTILELVATGNPKNNLTTINLRAGSILNEITEPLNNNSTYIVNTPKATMAVRGTSFVVSVERLDDGTYNTRLSTAHGNVAVQLIDKDGAPKGEVVTVEPDKSVLIVTTPNEGSNSDAEIDGNSFFAIYDTETGELTPVSEAEAKTDIVYEEIPEDFLYRFIKTNDDNEIVLDEDVLDKITNALSKNTDTTPEETTVPEETTLPEETTVPEETTLPEETTTIPVETTTPIETTVPETTTAATTVKATSGGGSSGGGSSTEEEKAIEFLAFYDGESSAKHHELYTNGDTVTLPSAPTGFDSSAFGFGWINVSSGFTNGTGLADGTADYSNAFSYDSSLVTSSSTILPAGSTVNIGTNHARYVGVIYSTITYKINDTTYQQYKIVGSTPFDTSSVINPTEAEILSAYGYSSDDYKATFTDWIYLDSTDTEISAPSSISSQYGNVTAECNADISPKRINININAPLMDSIVYSAETDSTITKDDIATFLKTNYDNSEGAVLNDLVVLKMGTTNSGDGSPSENVDSITITESMTDIYVSAKRTYMISVVDATDPSHSLGTYSAEITDFAETTITIDVLNSAFNTKLSSVEGSTSGYTILAGARPKAQIMVEIKNITVNMVTTEGSYTMTVAYGEVLKGNAILTAHDTEFPRWSNNISMEFEGLSDTAIPAENSSGDDSITINSDGMTVYYSVKYSLPIDIVKRSYTSTSGSQTLTSHNSQSFVLDAYTLSLVVNSFQPNKIDGTLYLGQNNDTETASVPWTIDSLEEYERCNDGGGRHVVYAEVH